MRQQNERPLPPSTYNDEVSETLSAAVLRALEGDPSRRYASADELADGLQRGLPGEDVTLPLAEGGTPTASCSAARPRPGGSTRDGADRVPAGALADPAPGGPRAPAPGAGAAPRRRGGRRSAAPSRASCGWCWRWSRWS